MGGAALSGSEMVVNAWIRVQTQLISLDVDALALIAFGFGHMIYKCKSISGDQCGLEVKSKFSSSASIVHVNLFFNF
jgi:hypothetical protein